MKSTTSRPATDREKARSRVLCLLGRASVDLGEAGKVMEFAHEPMAAATLRLAAWSATEVRQRIASKRTELG